MSGLPVCSHVGGERLGQHGDKMQKMALPLGSQASLSSPQRKKKKTQRLTRAAPHNTPLCRATAPRCLATMCTWRAGWPPPPSSTHTPPLHVRVRCCQGPGACKPGPQGHGCGPRVQPWCSARMVGAAVPRLLGAALQGALTVPMTDPLTFNAMATPCRGVPGVNRGTLLWLPRSECPAGLRGRPPRGRFALLHACNQPFPGPSWGAPCWSVVGSVHIPLPAPTVPLLPSGLPTHASPRRRPPRRGRHGRRRPPRPPRPTLPAGSIARSSCGRRWPQATQPSPWALTFRCGCWEPGQLVGVLSGAGV